ncbi:MAG: hypothetical protein ACO39F_06900 [Candidatus Nanopelagicaceae bacterium]
MEFDRKVKSETLMSMTSLVENLKRKLDILNAVDRDTTTSSAYDLTDQITTMTLEIIALQECIGRAYSINGEYTDED